MSALLTNLDLDFAAPRTRERARAQLRLLPARQAKLGTVGFVILLVTLLGMGMAGLLVLNVRIQQRAEVVNDLQTRATQLGYQQAALTSEAQRLRSTTNLQQQAWQLGLRPNPHPVFLVLPEGKVVGDPVRVSGSELGDLSHRSADEVAAQIAAANKAAIDRKRAKAEADRKAYLARVEAQKKAAAAKLAARKKEAADKLAKSKAQQTAPQKSTPAQKTTTKPSTGGH